MKIPLYKQETGWSCGAASMRMVLSALGVKKTEKEIIRLLKTNPIRGTWHKYFSKTAEKFKFNYITGRRTSTLRQLKNLMKQGYIVVVSYYLKDEKTGHYAIVKKIDSKYIRLLDPWYGKNTKYTLLYFKKHWHDLMKKYDKERRWFFAVKK